MAIPAATVPIQSAKGIKQDLVYIAEETNFLAIRQKFKDDIRRKMRTELVSAMSTASGSSEEHKKSLPYDNFGSFFGPSEPYIARRVIEETQNAQEIKRFASNAKKPVQNKMNTSVALSDKKKIHEMLRYARDYSFLNSPGSDLPRFAAKPSQGLESSKLQESKPRFQTTTVSEELKPVSSNMSKKGDVNGASVRKIVLGTKRKHEPQQDVPESKKKAKLMSENLRDPKHLLQKLCPKQAYTQQKLQSPTKQELKKVLATKNKRIEQTTRPLETKDKKIELTKKVPEPRTEKMKMTPEPNKAKKTLVKPKSSLQHKIPRPTWVFNHDESIEVDFNSILQRLSRGNNMRPIRWNDFGNDGDCMVSSFSDIQKEERKSARIARKEDEIERLREER